MKYRNGDVVSIPVTDEKICFAQVVEKLRGNVLLAVFSELLNVDDSRDVESLELDEPIFLLETMDLRITDGIWPITGNREVPKGIKAPEYKVWVDPPGGYRIQDIHGNLGAEISPERAGGMKLHKSFSPAVVEAAIRGFHGLGPWRPAFDELAF
ncbi:Imm26 family immunity protein [Streptomyces sp. NPDC001717]|uniref:Imm26 family immunity protein n=1 Tax=Streptomyces sp. NPDC001717 TaxID=3364604 RepID=UPI00368CE54C